MLNEKANRIHFFAHSGICYLDIERFKITLSSHLCLNELFETKILSLPNPRKL